MLVIVENKQYYCSYLSSAYHAEEITKLPWGHFTSVELVDTVTADRCLETTHVKSCWTENMLYFQFRCLDFYVISDYKQRDDPLYNQDVIEIFIDEQGSGENYIELEVSPNNIVFDARIKNDGFGTILETDLQWDIKNLVTCVEKSIDHYSTYFIGIPTDNFQSVLRQGRKLKVNFYRIDEKQNGTREYQAWSPTGAVQYHLPVCFGTLILQ